MLRHCIFLQAHDHCAGPRDLPCRLKPLWTVNLGAGLGTVGGADQATPHSAPLEPATPVHMPITRRHSKPVVPRTMRLRHPISLRRGESPPSAERPNCKRLPLEGCAKWNGSFSLPALP
jgi:hypothetical protein